MTPIADMVKNLLEKGVPHEAILIAIEGAELAATAAGASRYDRDNPRDNRDEKRRETDRLRQQRYRDNNVTLRNDRDNPRDERDSVYISKVIKKDRERQNKGSSRGTRIAPDWSPSSDDRSFAKREGFSEFEAEREAQKFRDFWIACAGAKGVKLDWTATWRQWIRNGAERSGKTPAPVSVSSAEAAIGYYAKGDSAQIAAWDDYMIRTTGKSLPRDRNFGWRVASEWPPDEHREAAE